MTFIGIVFPKLRTPAEAINTFTADDKYSLLHTDKLKQPILMQLSQN